MQRNERRRLLREKIAAKRAHRSGYAEGSSVAAAVQNDPTSALLAMGVDDAAVLQLFQHAKRTGDLQRVSRAVRTSAAEAAAIQAPRAAGDDGAEEAPPPQSDDCIGPKKTTEEGAAEGFESLEKMSDFNKDLDDSSDEGEQPPPC